MPPGSSRGSGASGGGGGSGADRTRRSSSATGAALSTTWPLAATEPSASALRVRASTGSSPTAAANLSICDSYAKQTWTAPKPRIAPQGGLLVKTARQSRSTLGTSYGPAPRVAAFAATAPEVEV